MVDLLQLQQYLEEVKAAVPAIKTTRLVIDDTQITEIIKEIKVSDNLILLGIVPAHQVRGTSYDNVQSKDIMAFLVLKKADRKEKHSVFITNLHKCQQAIRAVQLKLLTDMDDDENCGSFLRQLDVGSMAIDPVWQLGGADGYEINFSLYTSI